MKIYTITCHDVYNVGASLQAYALSEYLLLLGHEVEIIDYKPDYLQHYKLFGIGNPVYDKPVIRWVYNLLKLPGRVKARYGKRKKEFDIFTKKYLKITEKKYHSNQELTKAQLTADVFICGSDQIWNPLFNNGRDPAFYLDFSPEKSIKASFAASFAVEDVPSEWKSQIGKWINNLDYVSVREKSGLKILESMEITEVVQVMDPVFLLEKNVWISLEKRVVEDEEYVLVYDFDNNPRIREYALKLSQNHGWKIFSILSSDYCERCFSEEGPQAFLSLIHNAKFVISNSFHATAFSLIFEREFVVFNRLEKINSRMRDLLDLVGLGNHMLSESEMFDYESIDYQMVSSFLNTEIQNSRSYLVHILRDRT